MISAAGKGSLSTPGSLGARFPARHPDHADGLRGDAGALALQHRLQPASRHASDPGRRYRSQPHDRRFVGSIDEAAGDQQRDPGGRSGRDGRAGGDHPAPRGRHGQLPPGPRCALQVRASSQGWLLAGLPAAPTRADDVRRRPDETLRLPLDTRATALRRDVIPAIAASVDAALNIRFVALQVVSAPDPVLTRPAVVQELGWRLRDTLGSGRSNTASAIAAGQRGRTRPHHRRCRCPRPRRPALRVAPHPGA